MTQTRHLINGNIEEKGFNINNFQILYTNRGGTAMFFLISWSAANDEGLFLDKSAKSSPCQVKCPNQNQGSQLLRADCNSFFDTGFMSNLSKTESRKAVRTSKPLFAQIQDPVPSLHSPDCLTVLILRVQIDQMMVVAPGVAYGT